MREALLINDTRAAIKFFDGIGDLQRYARMRGTTALAMRSSMLPAFGFDQDGVVRYDIGGNTIEVSITQEMKFRLFDTKEKKEIRSFPKKSDDPEKTAACAKEFAALKKEVLAFAKERTALLQKMHLSGEAIEFELWQKIYVEHPVIRNLTRLIVWQDAENRSFVVTGTGCLDQQGQAYTPSGKIRVAHVLGLSEAEIDAWQQWFVQEELKQPFEQIWEPVITWQIESIRHRYDGVVLTKKERADLKKALSLRGIDVRSGEASGHYDPHLYGKHHGGYAYSDENDMYFGTACVLHYRIDEDTGSTAFGEMSMRGEAERQGINTIGGMNLAFPGLDKAAISFQNTVDNDAAGDDADASDEIREPTEPNYREMNAILLELDKATASHHVTQDNDTALHEQVLAVFTAAQIASLLALAIASKAARCTALLLDYKHTHFPEFEAVEEFTLDW